MASEEFCRVLAQDEPIAGTAKPSIHRWLLVEDGGPWGSKVPRSCELPDPVIARLVELGAEPQARVLMIRRPCQGRGPRRRVFIVDTPVDGQGRRIAALELELDAIATLDPDALMAVHGRPATRLDELWLVCTHGTRDRCCAKWGIPVWDRVQALLGERAWQTSHLSGHRFAPTFVVLPAALNWGRFDPEGIDELAAALERGELGALDSLRGRSSYAPAAQVAELALRQAHGWRADGALTLREVARVAPSSDAAGQGAEAAFLVTFDTPDGPRALRIEPTSIPATPSNCGEDPSPRVALRLAGGPAEGIS